MSVAPEREPMTWDSFSEALARSLERMAPREYLILEAAPPDPLANGYFVQFAREQAGLLLEAVSNLYLEDIHRLDVERERVLVGLGWEKPKPRSKHLRNWRRRVGNPVDWKASARLAVQTLRDVYGVSSPSELRYNRFHGPSGDRRPDDELGIQALAKRRRSSDPDAVIDRALASIAGPFAFEHQDDGRFGHFGGVPIWVLRVEAGTQLLRAYSAFRSSVPSSPRVFEALNEANSTLLVGRVLWVNDALVAAVEVPADHLNDDLVVLAVLMASSIATRLDADLGPTVGGISNIAAPAIVN